MGRERLNIPEYAMALAHVASLRSEDGYPIRFVDEDGLTVGVMSRIDAEEMKDRKSVV